MMTQFNAPEVHDEAEKAAIESAISACVQRFYAKGMDDPLLGPVFSGAIPDLPAHLEIIKNGRVRSLALTGIKVIPILFIQACRLSPNTFNAGWNYSLRVCGKHCRGRKPNRQWPRQVI
jgi:hypothetical protein